MNEKELIEYPVVLVKEKIGCLAIIPDIDGRVQGIEEEDTLRTAAEYIGEEIIEHGILPVPDIVRLVDFEEESRGKIHFVEIDFAKYRRIYLKKKIRQASNYLMEKNKEVYRRFSEK